LEKPQESNLFESCLRSRLGDGRVAIMQLKPGFGIDLDRLTQNCHADCRLF
jgi:hypothetical protein